MKRQDMPTYPDNGVIYEGDYLKDIPFGEYIKEEEVPTGNVYDIRDYGAEPGSGLIDTEAFMAAAEAAAVTKGTVLVKGGEYITGSIRMYSGTTLFIDKDSTIRCTRNLDEMGDAFFSIQDVENVTVCGGGRLHASGEYYVNLPKEKPLTSPLGYTKLPPVLLDPLGYPEDTIRFKYRERIRYQDDRWSTGAPDIKRPMYTFWIRNSKNIRVSNIIIEDSLDWSLDIDYSENIIIRDVVINNNRHVANTDGIDVMSSTNVTVSHCFVSTADDGLCVKAPMVQGHDGLVTEDADLTMGPARNILFEDCTVCTVMNAFKIGTETYFPIENVTVRNCIFKMPDIYPGTVSGISIESADGSHLRNIVAENITMNNTVCPIFICLCRRNKFGYLNADDEKRLSKGGSISGVTIKNITADNMEIPCLITGFDDGETVRRVSDIRLENIKGTYLDNEEILDIRTPLYENIKDYPESNAFGDLPAYGLFIRHAENVKLENVSFTPRSCNSRDEIIKVDVV